MDDDLPLIAPPAARRARRVDSDDWEPPKWAHPRATVSDLADDDRPTGARAVQRRVRPSVVARSGVFVGFAIAPAVTALLALLVTTSPRIYGTGDLPRGLLIVLGVQAIVVGALAGGDGGPLLASWVAMLFTTTVMLPILALQVSLLHEPFVAIANDSAGPALVATGLVLGLLIGYGLWCARSFASEPQTAGLAFIPAALAVPSMIGHAGTVTQMDGLRTLLEIGLVATICSLAVWSFPGWPQTMVAALALAVELLVLLGTGRGPWQEPTAGAIVPIVYVAMLVVTTLLVVFVPLLTQAAGERRRR